MNILVACERSQKVAAAFRAKGHNAFSNDLVSTFGDATYHFKGNVFDFLYGGILETEDREAHYIKSWDMLIAFPPCTYLTKAGSSLHSLKRLPEVLIRERTYELLNGAQFFMNLIDAPIEKIAIENPIGYMSTIYRKPDQIINPYQFCNPGDPEYVSKATCLWLKNLPKLETSNNTYPDLGIRPNGKRRNWTELKSKAEDRFITFDCIAAAMANKWG